MGVCSTLDSLFTSLTSLLQVLSPFGLVLAVVPYALPPGALIRGSAPDLFQSYVSRARGGILVDQ